MEPELENGQEVLVNRFAYMLANPKAGDVIVFLPNGNQNTHYYVKRVVACPGDTVQIRDGVLYINGEATEDAYDLIADAGIAEKAAAHSTRNQRFSAPGAQKKKPRNLSQVRLLFTKRFCYFISSGECFTWRGILFNIEQLRRISDG